MSSGSGISNGSSAKVVMNYNIVAGNYLLDGVTENNCQCYSPFAGAFSNIDSGNSCGFLVDQNMVNTDPKLGRRDNGWPTLTLAPLHGRPAIDNARGEHAMTLDQGSRKRPSGKYADIGAVEYYSVIIPPVFMLLE